MKVKICGITNLEDALFAAQNGADALGFVFYEKSPRYITPQKALEISKNLPPFITKVGLFVNKSAKEINEISTFSKMNMTQIHFEADKKLYDELLLAHIKVIRAKSKQDLLKYPNEYKIVDAFTESYGGSGKRINLQWFNDIDKSKIILAGGLNDKNIDEVLNQGFYGVDVSSGVEKYKGKKDLNKVKNFIAKVKKI